MKAARLHQPGTPLTVEEIREPELRPGSVIVRVESAFVAPSASDVVGGRLPFPLPPTPFTPGMDTIGVIERVAGDVHGLDEGQRVYCDHYFATRVPGAPPDASFIGYFGFTPASRRLLENWRDGSFAEKVVIPAECVTPLGPASSLDASRLCRLGYLGTAYGAFLRGGFRPSQNILVNGATGVLGVSTVLLGLAMGASRVACVGRKERVLARLHELDPRRIVTVARRNDGSDAARIAEAAAGSDLMIDALGYVDDPSLTLDALAALRPGGTAVLIGGGMADLPIPYRMVLGMEFTLRGSVWFPRAAAAEMLAMIGAGSLNLSGLVPRVFPLESINEAIAAAAARPDGFEHVALMMR